MFETKEGRKLPYHNMFVFSPVSTYESEDYKASGFKAEKKKPHLHEKKVKKVYVVDLLMGDEDRGSVLAPALWISQFP